MSSIQDPLVDTVTVYRLIYRSHSRIPELHSNEEFGRLLRVSRANNAAAGISGALLFYDNWFAQVLEGPEAAIRPLFARISADPRHDTIEVNQQGQVPGRAFARWAMAHVGEHGSPDIPLTATRSGVAEGAAWAPSGEQEILLRVLRDLTRGYGIGG